MIEHHLSRKWFFETSKKGYRLRGRMGPRLEAAASGGTFQLGFGVRSGSEAGMT